MAIKGPSAAGATSSANGSTPAKASQAIGQADAAGLTLVTTASAAGWMTPAEAAAFLRTTYARPFPQARTVLSWTRHRTRPLPCIKLGHRVLIHRDVLQAWVRERGP